MRTLCCFLIGVLTVTQVSAQPKVRSAYVCQALILKKKANGGPRAGDTAFPLRFRNMLQASVAGLSGERRAGLTKTIHRLVVDVKKRKERHFAVKQELFGAEQIRSYLSRVETSAERLEREHVAAEATKPFRARAVLARDTIQTILTGAIVGGLAYLTGELFHADHQIIGVAGAAATFAVIYKTLVPYLMATVADVRNYLVLRAHARGQPVVGPTTADARDEDFFKFAGDVREALKSEGTMRSSILWTRSRASIPLSRSTTAFWMAQREAPSAAQIHQAMRRSGNFRLPLDARVLETDHLFFWDAVAKQPVLITFVRERGSY